MLPTSLMVFRTQRSGDRTTVHLSEDLDLSVREPLRRALASLVDAPEATIDVTDVTYADTALLSAVIHLVRARRARGHDLPLHLVGMHASVRRLFELTHVDRLVDFPS